MNSSPELTFSNVFKKIYTQVISFFVSQTQNLHPFSNKWILFCIIANGLNNFILTRFYLLSTAFLVLIDMMIKYIIILLHWSIFVLVFSFDELTFYICPSLWWMLPLWGTFRKIFQQFIQDECVSICMYVHETEP